MVGIFFSTENETQKIIVEVKNFVAQLLCYFKIQGQLLSRQAAIALECLHQKLYSKYRTLPKTIMHQINLKEAETRLAELIEEVAGGEEVVITRSDGSSFKIVPLNTVEAIPKFGSAKGMVKMSDDFDAPLEDFEAYAP